jgi:2-polyprenyl-3-methyl-5-hydroxy-6-metoxy-1,4-benzoquinol methylase
MNYEIQRSFLDRQRLWLVPSAIACVALLAEALRAPSVGVKIFGSALALGLLWAAYYLPNYLGLDADPWRRLFWLSRARWLIFALFAIAALLAGAKSALVAVLCVALLHFAVLKILLKMDRRDLRDPIPGHLTALAFVYAAADFVLLWLLALRDVSTVVSLEFVLCFLFLWAVLLRTRSVAHLILFPLLAVFFASFLVLRPAAPDGYTAAWYSRSDLAVIAVLFWTAGTIHLLIRANKHNLRNYDDLLENLQAFLGETRESILKILLMSVPTLAENWRRDQPQGQDAVKAWYSANARLYLLANCQHHLLYRHIMYTLALLRVGRGRVLDFGGGNGDFSRALARRGFDATYLDVPGDAARYVKWRAEREGLPLKVTLDKSTLAPPYDVIFCLDVVEHLVDLPPVFELFKSLLKPGGKLLATYYNGPTSSAPMHIDPGYDALEYLLAHGFRNVKSKVVSLFSPELMKKPHFMILERESS